MSSAFKKIFYFIPLFFFFFLKTFLTRIFFSQIFSLLIKNLNKESFTLKICCKLISFTLAVGAYDSHFYNFKMASTTTLYFFIAINLAVCGQKITPGDNLHRFICILGFTDVWGNELLFRWKVVENPNCWFFAFLPSPSDTESVNSCDVTNVVHSQRLIFFFCGVQLTLTVSKDTRIK